MLYEKRKRKHGSLSKNRDRRESPNNKGKIIEMKSRIVETQGTGSMRDTNASLANSVALVGSVHEDSTCLKMMHGTLQHQTNA